MNDLISVIIPAYNAEKELDRCLRSVTAQTYKELEIILVDDGSTDRTSVLCDEWAAGDSRIRVTHQQNGGVSSARNTGLQAATGFCISFVDSDDEIDPDMLRSLYEALVREQADCAMCGYDEELPDGVTVLKRGTQQLPPCSGVESITWILRRDHYFTALWNKLFVREKLLQNGVMPLFDSSLSIGEDETWLMRVLPLLRRVTYVPKPLYRWHSRPDSASRTEKLTSRTMSVLRAKQITLELSKPFGTELVHLAESRLLNDCYHLKVLAYREHDHAAMKTICAAFRGVVWPWLFSNDVPLLRKGKVICMDLMMLLHLPSSMVDHVYSLKRQHG